MIDPARYAIYYMPAVTHPLWHFGSRVLGYDAFSPEAPPAPFHDLSGIAPPSAFSEPSIYGFHATLKAPFRLVDTADVDELLSAAQTIATRERPFGIGRLEVARLQRFIALIPARRSDALHEFADRCVRGFDLLRAPLSAADRARRLAAPLSPAEITHLDRWGYSYVFERFQFHMTLSGPLAADTIQPLHAALTKLYVPIDADLTIDGFAVFKQAAHNQRFQVLHRFAFGS